MSGEEPKMPWNWLVPAEKILVLGVGEQIVLNNEPTALHMIKLVEPPLEDVEHVMGHLRWGTFVIYIVSITVLIIVVLRFTSLLPLAPITKRLALDHHQQ